MSEHDDGEKTEEATPERRRRAREQGQFPRSKDAQAVAASLAVLLSLTALSSEYGALLETYTKHHFGEPYALVHGEVGRVFADLGGIVLRLVVPPACIAVAMSLLVGFAEAGIEPRLELLLPNWNRLNPVTRLRQVLSPRQQAITGLLTLARVVVIGAVSALLLRDAFPLIARLTRAELGAAVHEVLTVAMRFSLWASVALVVLAALDYFQSWLQHERSIRMTKQEVKEEHHQQEGNPRVRAKQRARAREIVRRGLAKEVKQADVVVANPTHISVVLRYRPERGAPIVSAKGYDEIALYIRKLATEHGVPVVENRPLARALAASVRVGRPVPVELYAAVAEVLAFVYRLKTARLRGRRGAPAARPRHASRRFEPS